MMVLLLMEISLSQILVDGLIGGNILVYHRILQEEDK